MTETKLPGMVINRIDTKETYDALVEKGEIGENDLCLVEDEDNISLGVTSAAVGDIVKVKAVDASGKPTEWEATNDDGKWKHVIDITTTEQVDKIDISQDKNGASFEVLQYNELWIIGKMVGVESNKGSWWRCVPLTDTNIDRPVSCTDSTTGTAYMSWYIFIRGNKLYGSDSSKSNPYGENGDGGQQLGGDLLDSQNSNYIKKLSIYAFGSTGGVIAADSEIRVMGRKI